MAPVSVRTYPGRSSKLLNLNRSFTPQKRIAAANAATSPFLKLPPELKSRIYDYIFGSNLIIITAYPHSEHHAKRADYEISSCTCEGHHTQLSPRIRRFDHGLESPEIFGLTCQGCTAGNARQRSATQAFGLSLLQVCRQVYHEAALKPFQEGFFVYEFGGDCNKGEGLQASMDAVIPAQLNSIRRLQLCRPGPAFLKSSKLATLKGLRHLMVRLGFMIISSDRIRPLLESFACDTIVLRMAELNLRSCRLDMELHQVREVLALLGETFKMPTAIDVAIFEEILRHTETALLQATGQ